MSSKPACKYGAACYRKNPDHLNRFSHPPKPAATPAKATTPSSESRQSQAATPPSVPAIVPVPSPVAAFPAEDPTLSTRTPSRKTSSGSLVVVLLVGVPGSGKSTFCERVSENAAQSWTRVCQDVVANGKRGTKAQCLKQATEALNSGSSIFIDRCNLNKEQRAEFLEFAAKSNVEAHSVVLNLPIGTCISRAAQRTSHEGDLQGAKAGAVIQRFAQTAELPSLDEGFARITVCRTDAEVEAAVVLYRGSSSSSKLPPGYFDMGSPTAKGSMERREAKAVPSSAPQQQLPIVEKEPSPPAAQQPLDTVNAADDMETEEEGSDSEDEDKWKTLAFPSLSTADFRFDHEKAADIVVETAMEFLNRKENDGLRLAMVDIQKDSPMLYLVARKAAAAGVDRRRFLVLPGDITKLKTSGCPECFAIGNAANWRLKGGGGGVNLAIYKAAGPGFEEATKKCAKVLNPGEAVSVPLLSDSPLRKEGVTHVIHVLGPNMNPQRPNCLNGDYVQGCKQLRAAYSSLFSTFAALAKGEVGTTSASTAGETSAPRDAFDVLMRSSKRKNGNGEAHEHTLKQQRTDSAEQSAGSPAQAQTAGSPAQVQKNNWPAWAQAIHDIAFHPERHQNVVIEVTNEAVVLPDMYAKAKKHLLIVSRVMGLDSIASVRKEHLPVLRQMHATGERWAKKYLGEDSSLVFRLGYHWVPSMRQLHLHVVSQDFDSPGLKNKKHWNSFTSEFFRDSLAVMAELEQTGKLNMCSEETEKALLDAELRCHRCRCVQPSIARLKAHIKSCSKPLPVKDEFLIKSGN